MKLFFKLSLIFSLLTLSLHAEAKREKLNMSMIISGGVSLGAYEAGYNWAMIKMLNEIRDKGKSETSGRAGGMKM